MGIFYLIVIIASFLRFWHTQQFFQFGVDEEYQALLAWEQVKNFHITFIGVSASNLGFYLGPGMTYIGWVLLSLSHGDPIIFGYFAAFLGVLTVISIYYIVSQLYNRYTAAIASLIYSLSAFVCLYDRKYWPLGVGLIAVWFFYSIIKLNKNPRWIIVAFALAGLSLHIHLSLLLFWPLLIGALVKYRRQISSKLWLLSSAIFLVLISPLIAFDFLHNFDNILAPLRMFTKAGEISRSFSPIYRLESLTLSLAKVFFSYPVSDKFFKLLELGGILIIVAIFLTAYKKMQHPATKIMTYFTALFLILLLLFPGPFQEYYVIIIMPFMAIWSALMLEKIPRPLTILILLVFAAVNLITFSTWPKDVGLQSKKLLIEDVTKYIGKKDFYLKTETAYQYFGGWRYLFEAYGRTPAQSDADQLFGWIYNPDEMAKKRPKITVLILNNEEKAPQYANKVFIRGAYKAAIIE